MRKINHYSEFFLEIIIQAMADSISFSKNKLSNVEKNKARNWLLGDSEHLDTICYLAKIEPDYLRHKAEKLIKYRDNNPKIIISRKFIRTLIL